MLLERFAVLLNSLVSTTNGAGERVKYLPPGTDITEGVFAIGFLGDQPVMRPPWGPFKTAEDAADYFEAKRRAHGSKAIRHFAGGGKPEHDGHIFCHDSFRVQIISAREFYVRHAAQMIQTATAMLIELSADKVEQMRVLAPVSGIELLT